MTVGYYPDAYMSCGTKSSCENLLVATVAVHGMNDRVYIDSVEDSAENTSCHSVKSVDCPRDMFTHASSFARCVDTDELRLYGCDSVRAGSASRDERVCSDSNHADGMLSAFVDCVSHVDGCSYFDVVGVIYTVVGATECS